MEVQMNEFFSAPLIMFTTIVVGVTIGVFAGGFLLQKWMRKWLLSQSALVNQNIENWNNNFKPIEGHVQNLNKTRDDFTTTQERYEQLAEDFRGHEGKIREHMSKADTMFREHQFRLDEKENEESTAAKDMKDQLQQLRQFSTDVTNHHKYNSLVEKLPALKSEKFEQISDDFFEINLQLQNFKRGLSPEEQDALLDQSKEFGDLIAAMIECISQVFMAECTKAIDPSRTQQMDEKLEEISQKFTEKTDKFVEQMATAQNQLQSYHAERLRQQAQREEYSQYRGQSRSR